MKTFNSNFFNILRSKLIIIAIVFNIFLFSSNIPGKKIKKQKTYDKAKIKKSILNRILKSKLIPKAEEKEYSSVVLENLSQNAQDKYKNSYPSVVLENLSQSAQERYKLENNYIQTEVRINDEKYPIASISEKKSILPYIKKNYVFIKNFLINKDIPEFSLSYYIALLLLNKYLAAGNSMNESLDEIVIKIKKYIIDYDNGFLSLLYDAKNKNIINDFYDEKMIKIINNMLLYNGSNKIEIDRAINRFYNNANRNSGILIIEQYEKNNFSTKENNNTYGELSPSKDLYQKIIYDKTKLESQSMRDRFQLSRRNFPAAKPKKIMYYIAVPKIKNNMVRYMTFNASDNNQAQIKSVEAIINNLDPNYFYSLFIIPDSNNEKELDFFILRK